MMIYCFLAYLDGDGAGFFVLACCCCYCTRATTGLQVGRGESDMASNFLQQWRKRVRLQYSLYELGCDGF
jgi:hypothetical protein